MATQEIDSNAVIWQGYHHAWEYNHRVNRFGSYVRYEPDPDQPTTGQAVVGHTAASGTGGDTAHFSEFITPIHAQGVGFQPGFCETVVECPRAEVALFRIKVDDLELAPELVGKSRYTVLINGFDLIADGPAGKILAFDLEMTDPAVYAAGSKIRFNILGSLSFDCRSTECNTWPFRVEVENVHEKPVDLPAYEPIQALEVDEPPERKEGISRRHFDKAITWLKRQVVALTNLDEVRRSITGSDPDALKRRLFRAFNKRFYLRLFKWRIFTPYILRVHYMIVAGDTDSLELTESDYIENNYAWNLEDEIHLEQQGTHPIHIQTDAASHGGLKTMAFKHLSLQVEIDEREGTTNPVQWGKGMHFLEWSVAVRDIQSTNGEVTALLDLFYKCWSEAMNEVITMTTWGSYRAAGKARLGARLVLLHFKNAVTGQQQQCLPGRIHWPGGGLSAKRHPRAQCERRARE